MMKHPSPLYQDSKRIIQHIHWASTRRQALIQVLWCFNSLGPHSHSLRYMLLWCPYYRWENRPREHCFQQLHSLYVAAPGLKPGILASEPVFIITNILPPLKYHAWRKGWRKKLVPFLMKPSWCSKEFPLADFLKVPKKCDMWHVY